MLFLLPLQVASSPKKPASSELKLALSNAKRGSVTLGELDAQSFDVYRGAHAVLLLYDPAKRWFGVFSLFFFFLNKSYFCRTFDLCKTWLMSSIPANVDVLLLANYRDRAPVSGTVTVAEGRALAQQRKQTSFLECSCKDGFGKTQILSFLNVPFLRVQKAHLEALLARNAEDLGVAVEEFDLISFELDYSSYLTWVKASFEFSLFFFFLIEERN